MRTFRLSRATEHDFGIVINLIEAAAKWLRTKDTDQWRDPWPNLAGRNARVRNGLRLGTTWIVWAYAPEPDRGDVAVATITLDATANPIVWDKKEAAEPAAYVNRLVVHREYGGRGLGAALLSWAAKEAAKSFGAEWIRIDVWTNNEALHKYYQRQGFEKVKPDCSDPNYPSRARFKRHVGYVGDDGGIELKVVSGPAPQAERLRCRAVALVGAPDTSAESMSL